MKKELIKYIQRRKDKLNKLYQEAENGKQERAILSRLNELSRVEEYFGLAKE